MKIIFFFTVFFIFLFFLSQGSSWIKKFVGQLKMHVSADMDWTAQSSDCEPLLFIRPLSPAGDNEYVLTLTVGIHNVDYF